MEFTLADQTVYFLSSLLFGVFISALYDVVRILRFVGFTRLWQIVITDILYFFVCAVLTVLFALPFNKGLVRYFVIFGEALGFIAYRFTLGEVTAKIYGFIIRVLRKILKKTLKLLVKILNKLLKVNRFVVYNVGVILYKTQNIVFRKKRKTYEHKEKS